IGSRGCDVEELTTSIWFGGPSFLLDSENNWPVNKHFKLPADVMSMELGKPAIALVVSPEANYVLQKIESFSSHLKLLRVFVWVFRFIQRCRKVSKPFEKSISPRELDFAFDKIVEVVQFHEFRDDISKIRKNKPVATNIQKLIPFLQENKLDWCSSTLLRVGGRLLNAPIPYEAKFPLLLSRSSQFVRSYVSYLHVTNCHAGPRALVSRLREKIWLVNAQEVCRRTVRSCMRCFRCKPQLLTQIMGNLPADRLRALRPFNICGVDFCGPFSTTYRIRGKPPYKSYVALFVCFASKAVWCDNATNFVGADRHMREFRARLEEQGGGIETFASKKGCEFAFIPPRAPHFGGLWEAGVKSANHLFLRTVGQDLLTAEELGTLLTSVEAVLNSRSLGALSSDPNDEAALFWPHHQRRSRTRS
ncbi:hypothetical protein M5D96_012560, partial [Drosophila gunungcola]